MTLLKITGILDFTKTTHCCLKKGLTYGHLWSHILYQQQPIASPSFAKSAEEDWTFWLKAPGKMFWGWHLYVSRRMSHPSYPKTSISLSTARRLTLAWSEKLEVIKILSRRTYWARTGPMTARILIVVQPSRIRFYRSCDRKSHGKTSVKLSQSIVKTTSLCYRMFFRDIDRWKSTKRK